MDVKRLALGFGAGFLAVLLFHQTMAVLLYAFGAIPAFPYSMAPRPPLGVPAVLSAAFWGGVWGIALVLLLRAKPAWPPLIVGAVFGALALTFVALSVVPALRGQPVAFMDPWRWWRGMLLNGAWGVGAVLIYRLAEKRFARRWWQI